MLKEMRRPKDAALVRSAYGVDCHLLMGGFFVPFVRIFDRVGGATFASLLFDLTALTSAIVLRASNRYNARLWVPSRRKCIAVRAQGNSNEHQVVAEASFGRTMVRYPGNVLGTMLFDFSADSLVSEPIEDLLTAAPSSVNGPR